MNYVATSNVVIRAEVLPPTERAAHFHSLRVYIQVMDWKHLKSTLHRQDWGWKLQKGQLMPITTDQDPAQFDVIALHHPVVTILVHVERMDCTVLQHAFTAVAWNAGM